MLEILNTVAGQFYYPVEHLAWAAENKLIPIESARFWTISVFLWALSVLINCLQAIGSIVRINRELSQMSDNTDTTRKLGSSGSSGPKRVTFKTQKGSIASVKSLKAQRFFAILTVVQSVSDMMNAVNWMPAGILWSGRLSHFWVGLFGMISSIIGLYRILPPMASLK